jgi:hypothetical protein
MGVIAAGITCPAGLEAALDGPHVGVGAAFSQVGLVRELA